MNISNLQYNRYEKAVLKSQAEHILKSLVAGTSYTTRLSSVQPSAHLQTIWDTGSNVIGPLFFFFVYWLLEEAKKKGIKRLYFLARTSQILYKIARILNEKRHYEIECIYLYGSREAFVFPALESLDKFELDWILPEKSPVTLESLFKTLRVSDSQVQSILEIIPLSKNITSPLNDEEVQLLKDKLFHNQELLNLIKEQREQSSEAVINYLKLLRVGEENSALVDIGWSCTSQFAISKILEKFNSRPANGLKGFYFGFSNKYSLYKNDEVFSFIKEVLGLTYIHHFTLYEIFGAADHGKTKSFTMKNNQATPIFDNIMTSKLNDWGIPVQQESILGFTETFIENYKEKYLNYLDIKIILNSIVPLFYYYPSPKEAEVYGQFVTSTHLLNSKYSQLAPQLTIYELLYKLINGDRNIALWIPGALTKSNLKCLVPLWKIFEKLK
jgi:predicted HAD superfamily hydrolase